MRLGKLVMLAVATPQGRRAVMRAKQAAMDPVNQRKAKDLLARVTGGGAGGPGGPTGRGGPAGGPWDGGGRPPR